MFKRRIWIAAVIICLLYWATWHGYTDDPKTNFKANPVIRHSIDYLLLITVAFTGWWGWNNHHQQWVKHLWVFIYLVIITSIGAFGVIDHFFTVEDLSVRNLLSGLRLFFNSPVPYGILIYFAKRSHAMAKQRIANQ